METPNITWRTSTRTTNGADCVEIGAVNNAIAVRDSKHPTGPELLFSRNEFTRFADRLKQTSTGG